MQEIAVSGNADRSTAVDFARRGEIAPERLFDDGACVVGQSCATQSFDHRREQQRRNGEVVRRAARTAECSLERLERAGVPVITIDVTQQRQ